MEYELKDLIVWLIGILLGWYANNIRLQAYKNRVQEYVKDLEEEVKQWRKRNVAGNRNKSTTGGESVRASEKPCRSAGVDSDNNTGSGTERNEKILEAMIRARILIDAFLEIDGDLETVISKMKAFLEMPGVGKEGNQILKYLEELKDRRSVSQ